MKAVLCLLACLAGVAPALADDADSAARARIPLARPGKSRVRRQDRRAGQRVGDAGRARSRRRCVARADDDHCARRRAGEGDFISIIDDNPSPVAAHFTFGPAADPHVSRLRVRVNSYTNVHAVAELQDGSLVEDVEIRQGVGRLLGAHGRRRRRGDAGHGRDAAEIFRRGARRALPTEAVLMVRHPNFNGMQMNQATRLYTPARYIDRITMKDGDRLVFDLETGISLWRAIRC